MKEIENRKRKKKKRRKKYETGPQGTLSAKKRNQPAAQENKPEPVLFSPLSPR
jgi:hypothetical protein